MEHLDFFGFFFNSRIFLGFYCGLQNYGIIEILDQWMGRLTFWIFLDFCIISSDFLHLWISWIPWININGVDVFHGFIGSTFIEFMETCWDTLYYD
mgnify:FL=1